MTITAQQMIDTAQSQHWSFKSAINEGAALQFLDEQQKSFLLDLARTIEALIGTTEDVQTGLSGAAVVALDANGTPYFTTTTEPGYAIRFSGGVPYVMATDPIIVDPFGEDGDAPGLPLPDDLLRLIFVSAKTATRTIVPIPIEVLNSEIVRRSMPRTGLQAFLNANRLIPVRIAEADLWTQVTSIQIGCIICPSLTALTDELTIPMPCQPALRAALTCWMANQSEKCPIADKRAFEQKAAAEYERMTMSVNAMDAVTTSSVIYRR